MKTCFRCNTEKPLTEFYGHAGMADGHLNKCKACTRADAAAREARLMSDPQTMAVELLRHRQKSRKYSEDGRARQPDKESRTAALLAHKEHHPEAVKARNAVASAIRSGRLTRLPCRVCGSEKVEGHHEDHSKPLEVIWLCVKHHAEADNALRLNRKIRELETA